MLKRPSGGVVAHSSHCRRCRHSTHIHRQPRLFLSVRIVRRLRRHSATFDLHQSVPADDAGADFPHTRARQEQLRERVGTALISSATALLTS